MVAIGIDLGTTYSCVAVCLKERLEVLHNREGSRTTPSCVAFTEQEVLVGEAALNQMPFNINNTVYGVKRMIGRRFNDEAIQKEIKTWPFQVVDNGENRSLISVTFRSKPEHFLPEEISSIVLGKLKQQAETFLKDEVKDAVITVPAYFNDAQRNSTKIAGTIAGLNVLRIINEPTAAALAYGLDKIESPECHNILIYDLGGGTFDVSVVAVEDGVFEVLATTGDTRLGGEDFTYALAQYTAEEIRKQTGTDITNDTKTMQLAKISCENAKRQLSSALSAVVCVNVNGTNCDVNLTRANFERINNALFDKTLQHVTEALKLAKMDKSEINDVVLIGGSTRIPYIQEKLKAYFNNKTLMSNINPDEAVAVGAAIQAALLSQEKPEYLTDTLIMDVTPMSVGIEVVGGFSSVILARNTQIPAKVCKQYRSVWDDQKRMLINVFEGEERKIEDNNSLGVFYVDNLPKGKARSVIVYVSFNIDCNGMLLVTAEQRETNNTVSKAIVVNKERLSEQQVNELVEKARANEEREVTIARRELETLCDTMCAVIRGSAYDDVERNIVTNECNEALAWLRDSTNLSLEDIITRRQVLIELCPANFNLHNPVYPPTCDE